MTDKTTPSDHSHTRRRFILRYVLSAGLTLLFLWLAFRGQDFQAVYQAIREAHYGWMLVSVLCLMCSHVIRAWRWRYLLEPIKPDIGLRNLFSGVLIGYFLNNVLPRAGEFGRPYAIGKLESISKTAAFGTIVVERLMDTLSFLFLVLLIPFVYNGPLRESFPWLMSGGAILSVVTAIVLVILIVMMIRRDWTNDLLRIVARILSEKIATRIKEFVHLFLDGLLFLKNPRRFVAIGVSSVLVWGFYLLMTYTAFYAFDLQGRLDMGAAIVLLAITSIGVAIPTPGSTGGYHFFAVQTLTKLFSVDGAVALSYATITHIAGYIVVTIIGLYFFIKDQVTIAAAVTKPEDQEVP